MMMRIHLYAVFVSLCLNCAFGEGPKARPSIVVQQNNLLMVMTSVDLSVRQAESKEFHSATFKTATTTVTENGTELTAAMTFAAPTAAKGIEISQFIVNFNFKQEGGYWELTTSSVVLAGTEAETKKGFNFKDVRLLSGIGLQAYQDWSFHCSRLGPFYPSETPGNHTFFVDFNGFQVQPFTSNTTAFTNNVSECVGFFSIGILMGLFVTILLMAIIAWGLAMIMDVKTMDRFDDPKGKPISFGGAE